MANQSDNTTATGMTQSSVRASNLAMVFAQVLAHSGEISRADIAGRLGMTRSTVSRLVDDLILGELVEEGTAVGGARGRPAVPLNVRGECVYALGLEVNVERMVATLVDLTGRVQALFHEDAEVTSLSVEETMSHLAELARAALEEVPDGGRVVGARLAAPGLVDREGRFMLRAANLGWEGAQPAAHWDVEFQGRPLRLRLRNDIDCSALTVLREFPGTSFIYVTGEVGIGAAISLDGRLLAGSHGWAAELGHICVDPDGDVCGCGSRGCLETVAGAYAFIRAAGQQDIDGVVSALEEGDKQALAAVESMAEALGIALGAAMNLLDVNCVRLGGHLGRVKEFLLEPLTRELAGRVLWSPHSGIEVEFVEEAPLRAAAGAGLAALGHVIADPAAWVDPVIAR